MLKKRNFNKFKEDQRPTLSNSSSAKNLNLHTLTSDSEYEDYRATRKRLAAKIKKEVNDELYVPPKDEKSYNLRSTKNKNKKQVAISI